MKNELTALLDPRVGGTYVPQRLGVLSRETFIFDRDTEQRLAELRVDSDILGAIFDPALLRPPRGASTATEGGFLLFYLDFVGAVPLTLWHLLFALYVEA